jgi:leucyl-tRNA synthetase
MEAFSVETIKILLQLLAPLAPHLSEELWQKLGGTESIVNQPWPIARKELLVSDEVTIVFQVNGKLRGEAKFAKDASKEEIIATAKEHEKVLAFTTGKEIMKEIYVPGKLVNLAVKG